ncbi:MAG: B12-binding domain-containing radical SAM protein [Deltaproteobacteria bacterium]|nr:B12-binding domain-containing radical SAM protein [Deltaproteobacteria bacterium]
MKLLLILPTQLGPDGVPIRRRKASVNLNLNLPLLAGLTPRDVDIRIVNDYVEEAHPDWDVDLVGITTLMTTTPRAYQLADAFRARGKTVVLGGFHASAMPEEAAQHADAVVIGEADEVWPRLIDDFRSGRLRPLYTAERLPEMAGNPTPRYDLVPKNQYMVEVYPVESSRGCPLDCDYCAVTRFHGGHHRLRPIGEIVRDIRATNSRYIAFIDDNIIGHKSHARELFEALKKLNIRWMAQSTMYLADDEDLLDAAVASGLRFVWIGIESIKPAHLDQVHRKINQVDDFSRRIREFRRRGLLVGANMMFGFDDETREDYEATYRFLVENRVIPFLYILTPIPGTPLYDRMESEGRVLHHDWSRYTSYETVIQPKNFSPAELNDLYFNLAGRLFDFRNNFRRTIPTTRLSNLKEDLAIRTAAFAVGMSVGWAVRHRWPTYW